MYKKEFQLYEHPLSYNKQTPGGYTKIKKLKITGQYMFYLKYFSLFQYQAKSITVLNPQAIFESPSNLLKLTD